MEGVFLVALFLASVSGGALGAASLLEADARALLEFKNITRDPLLSPCSADPYYDDDCDHFTTWTEVNTVCMWQGVSCGGAGASKRVIGLSVSGFLNSKFPLPNVLSNLTALQILDLSNNFFAGDVPSGLGKLVHLTHLNLSQNALNGTFPESFNNLKQLVTLRLALARSSHAPPLASLGFSPGNLSKLEELDVSSNGISGILNDLPMAGAKSLTILRMRENNFTGPLPSWISQLTNLQQLDLGSTGLSASVLPSTAKSWPTSLEHIDLSSINLVGHIPRVLATLPSLTLLNLGGNSLNGTIAPEFGQMSSSNISLDFSVNQLSGPIPASLGNNAYGEGSDFNGGLILGNNTLGGDISEFVSALCQNQQSTLFHLSLEFNQLNGSIPAEFGNCSQVVTLKLNNNQFSGEIPSTLNKMEALTELYLQSNQLSGEIPSQLAEIPLLNILYLSYNNLSGPIPPAFNCSKQTLGQLTAANNSLAGGIPRKIGHCKYLSRLELQFNQIHGTIPASLFNASVLTHLLLNGNRLKGYIRDVEDWMGLANLDLSDNRLNASIPDSLGTNASNLQTLSLARNQLTGGIPSSLLEAHSLATIDLSGNQLDGSLPSSIKNTPSLTRLSLQQNNFSGPFPVGLLQQVQSLQYLDVRDNHFTGNMFLNNSRLVSLLVAGNNFSGNISSSFASSATLSVLDVSRNQIKGSISNLPPTLTLFNCSHNSLSGSIPTSMGNLTLLRALDLSANNLTGAIPPTITGLKNLQVLDVSGNNLSGTLPPSLGTSSTLTSFNVSDNNLTGQIPLSLCGYPTSAFSDNAGLVGAPLNGTCSSPSGGVSGPSPSPSPALPAPHKKGGGLSTGAEVGIIVGAVAAGIFAVLLLACIVKMACDRRGPDPKEVDTEKKIVDAGKPGGVFFATPSFQVSEGGQMVLFQRLDTSFGINDIVAATEKFNNKYLLGRGGFGSVYRASLGGDLEVAIKRLDPNSTQGETEFLAEMETLGKIQHRNLASLLGAYSDAKVNERLLIYKFAPGGNLASALRQGIKWPARRRIAIGSARGFKYLHHNCSPCIIHRDIKPENILLDMDLEPFVADFGLAKVLDIDLTHLSTRPLGTIGYMAPEYYQRHQITTKIDVFSFGVVLLQLVTGKSPVDPLLEDGLARWAKMSPFARVVDSTVGCDESNESEIKAVLRLGLLCSSRHPQERPTMEEVLRTLENLDEFAGHVLQA